MAELANNQGRTLLELCISLALFALTGAISAPRLAALSHQLKVRGTTAALEQITASLATLARQQDQTLLLRTISNQLVLSTRSSPPRRVRVLAIPPGLTIRINTTDQKILAHAGGTLSPARITITGETARCALTLSLRGRTRSHCGEDA